MASRACGADAARSPSQPPHLLVLMVDEMDGRVLDPASHLYAPQHMPNLRSLAARGANFVAAYSNSPQCTPSRASMFTGRRTDQIGVYNNGLGIVNVTKLGEADANCVKWLGQARCEHFAQQQRVSSTFEDALRDAGYNTTLYGKMHIGAGFGGLGQNHDGWTYATPFGGQWQAVTRAADIPRMTKDELSSIIGAQNQSQHPGTANDYTTTQDCVALLRSLPADAPPQLIYCSILLPHPAYVSNSTYIQSLNLTAIDVPDWPAQSGLHPNDAHVVLSKGFWDAADKLPVPARVNFLQVYFGMCAEADRLLGEVLDEATRLGDDAFTMFVGDHGDMALEHQQAQKNTQYEGSARVPTLLAGPGIAAGQVIDAPVSLLDVYPTLLTLAGVPVPDTLAGYSLTDLAGGPAASTVAEPPTTDWQGQPEKTAAPSTLAAGASVLRSRPDYVVSQYHSIHAVTGTYMVRQGEHKLILFAPLGVRNHTRDALLQNAIAAGAITEAELVNSAATVGDEEPPQHPDAAPTQWPPQLFHLPSDPHEFTNIAAQNPQLVASMTQLLKDDLGDYIAVDQAAKAQDLDLFLHTWYTQHVGSGGSGCVKALKETAVAGFEPQDAALVEAWAGVKCK